MVKEPRPHLVLKSLEVHEGLSLVVVCAAGVDGPVTDLGFERIGVPEIERIDRHHIVVAVNQDGRCFRIVFLLGEDDRVAGGLIDGGAVGTGLFQQFDQPFGAAVHVGAVG